MTSRYLPLVAFLSWLTLSLACHAQYQLLNPGFESWEGTSATARPSHWSSFPQADGSWAWAASTAQHYHRNGGRPGTLGTSYLTIYSRSVFGVVANGNMTTGQVHAGSTSASNASNYNYTHRGSDYCHSFSGTPDSMYVWVSYYAASGSSQGSVRVYLHGDNDFRDPNDSATANLYCGKAVAIFSRTTTSSSTPSWVQCRVPFVYDGTSLVNYLLVSMSTNTTPGGGSANDSLSVDDIEFVYSAWLDSIMVNGSPIASFQPDVFDYTVPLASLDELQSAVITYATQASDAIVGLDTFEVSPLSRQVVLNVVAEDSVTSHTYTVTLTSPAPVCDSVEGLSATVEGNSAFVNWVAGTGNLGWEVEYGLQGFSLGTGVSVTSNTPSVLLADLAYGSTYEVYVRAICSGSLYSDWCTPVVLATDQEPGEDCLPLDSIVVSEIGFDGCRVTLFSPYAEPQADVAYQLLLMHGGDTVVDTMVWQLDVVFHSLQEGTVYLLSARTLCDSLNRSGWLLATFTTLSDAVEVPPLTADSRFRLYPNPAQGKLNCHVADAALPGNATLTLIDAAGRAVYRQPIHTANQTLDISALPTGLYIAVIQTPSTLSTQRLSILH